LIKSKARRFAGLFCQECVPLASDNHNAVLSWVTYEFNGSIKGNFDVRIGNLNWPCGIMQGFDNKLLCYGLHAIEGMTANVILFNLDNQQELITLQGTTPYCQQAQVCEPPPEGCPPYRPNPNLPSIPTFWDATLCKCVPK
jgi:hypothetical protein